MFLNAKMLVLLMAKNLNVIEIITKHYLFCLRFYQIEIFYNSIKETSEN